MRRLYRLGQFFHRRYHSILGDGYLPGRIYVQSTDLDRTLMSAETMLAGLFIPSDEEKFIDNVLWQPTSVHTIPKEFDQCLSCVMDCPKYDFAFEQYMNESKEVQEIYTKYIEDFEYWSEMSGKNITDIKDVQSLYDTLKIEQDVGKVFVFN